MKTCTKCGETKPLDEYHKNANSKDGHNGICKTCACAKSRAYNAANKEHIAAYHRDTLARSRNARRRREAKNPGAYKARRSALRKARIDEYLAQEAANRKRQKQKFPEKIKAQQRAKNLQRYGMNTDIYNALLTAQGGCCGICKAEKPDNRGRHFYVDHDHKTGQVRGLLCHSCNSLLGHARDCIDVLAAAIVYLAKST